MRRLLLLALCAAVAFAQPKNPEWVPLNVNDAKAAYLAKELPSPVVGVVWLEGKGLLAAACDDGSLHSWKREESKDWLAKATTIKAHAKAITAIASAGDFVATASTDGKVHLWALPGDKPAKTFSPGSVPRSLAASADGKTLAVGCEDGSVRLVDPAAGTETKKLAGPTDWVSAVAVSADGKLVAAGGPEGKLWLWEGGTKKFDVLAQAPPMGKAEPPPANSVAALAFSPDGKQILLGGSNGTIYGFSLEAKITHTMAAHTAGVTGLWWHPGKLLFASTGRDRVVQLWSATGYNKTKALPGHDAWAEGAVGVAKATELASAGADKTVRLWTLGAQKPPMPKDKGKK